jgi:hypothetical protein
MKNIVEPEELKAEKDLEIKYLETDNTLNILNNTVASLKRQKELSHDLSQSLSTIGLLF